MASTIIYNHRLLQSERHKLEDTSSARKIPLLPDALDPSHLCPMKPTEPADKKFSFEKRWAAALKEDGHVQISTFFLENYHRLETYDLTYGEAMFVIHLMQHKWDENAPFPAYKTISQRTHVSVKTARRWAASLEQKGYLKREVRVGTTNRFDLKGLMNALVSLKRQQDQKKKAQKRKAD